LIQTGSLKQRRHVSALLARFHPYGRLKERLGEAGRKMRTVAGIDVLLAPFVDVGWPSRFSDGSFGVYYAAQERETAIAETVFHRSRLLAQSGTPPALIPVSAFTATIAGEFHDLRGLRAAFPYAYRKDDYSASQRLGVALHGSGSSGLAYDSVRREGGHCFAVMQPTVLKSCRRVEELCYRWDGKAIVEVLLSQKAG
jgi:hypothetical protein